MGLQSGMPLASGQTTSPSVLYSRRASQNVMRIYIAGKGSGSPEQQTASAWCTKILVRLKRDTVNQYTKYIERNGVKALLCLQSILQDMLSSRCQQAGSLMLLAKSYLLSSVHSAIVLSLQPGIHQLGSQHCSRYIALPTNETILMHVLDAVGRI